MNGKRAIKEVARRSGISKQEVCQEILSCMHTAQENDNTEIRAIWDAIPRKGREITPEELIEYIVCQVKLNLQKATNENKKF